jgi:hypothetical protein
MQTINYYLLKGFICKAILKNLKADLPEINFDIDAQHTFQEIKDLKPIVFRKLFSNDDIFSDILLTIFPQRITLNLLLNHFKEKYEQKRIYETLFNMLDEKLNTF